LSSNRAGKLEKRRIEKIFRRQTVRTPVVEAKILVSKAKNRNELSINISELLSNIDPTIGWKKTQILTIVFSKPVKRDEKYRLFKERIRDAFKDAHFS